MESRELEPESLVQTLRRAARIEGWPLPHYRHAEHLDAPAELAQLHRHARWRRHRAAGSRARRESDRLRLQRAERGPHGASAGAARRDVRRVIAGEAIGLPGSAAR